MDEYLTSSIENKIVFIWIRHLRYEFINCLDSRTFNIIINKIINPIESAFSHKEYNKIPELCKEGIIWTKEATGNQFHMNLFIELEKLTKELMIEYPIGTCWRTGGCAWYNPPEEDRMDGTKDYCIKCWKFKKNLIKND